MREEPRSMPLKGSTSSVPQCVFNLSNSRGCLHASSIAARAAPEVREAKLPASALPIVGGPRRSAPAGQSSRFGSRAKDGLRCTADSQVDAAKDCEGSVARGQFVWKAPFGR